MKLLRCNHIHKWIIGLSLKSNYHSGNMNLVGVAQFTSIGDKEKNFSACQSLLEKAKKKGAQMVFFPEAFDHICESRKLTLEMAETLNGDIISKFKNLAEQNNVWISLGGFHQKGPETESEKLFNTHVVINNSGEIVAAYNKVHLFDIEIPGKVRLKESDYTIPGSQIVPPVETPVGKVGLMTCYDLRFPELSLQLTQQGAQILTYPSAFTQVTGMAHWEPLLRARAIESQCYVIASAQTGSHNAKRASYGHAMVIDPWGSVVACCHEGTDIVVAEIDLDYLAKIRVEMPIWNHRRYDLYGKIGNSTIKSKSETIDDNSTYNFGQCKIQGSQLFYQSTHSIAFVNRKPVLPGHVLVSPLRIAKRLSDLSTPEVSDLFQCVQIVQRAVEHEHKTNSSTVAIQDGIEAGQTVEHIHVHILPRKSGDFNKNDDIYDKLQTHDQEKDESKWRTNEDMASEAGQLRKYFSS